ncbi:Mitochondria fission 1 protein [Verticillium dahliae VDG2]|nr:Mitochondria fission 1 protein [Verticillium dahliae VDG2]
MPTAAANRTMGRGSNAASASPTTADDELSDNESINSTIVSHPDSDTQWNFERVLSEAPNEDGDPWYLIQWTGYDKDEWTWEPETNITTVGLQEWAEMKAKIDRGEAEPFDIEAWVVEAAAMKEAKQAAQLERHRKRNLKRKRQGMPMNLYDDEQEQDYDTSDAEVGGDDDFNDVIPPPRQTGASEPQPRPRAQPNIGGPYSDLKPKRKAPAEKAAHQDRPAPPKKTSTRREPTVPTSTGYQGTARKASSSARSMPSHNPFTTASRTANKTNPAHPEPDMKKARRSAGEKTTCRTATGNVFISGKKVQTRPKFTDAMVDPTKEARLFHNYQTTRKAELKIRDIADKAPGNIRQLGLFNISTGVAETHTPNASGSGKTPVEASPVQERRSSLEVTKLSLKKLTYSEAFDNDKPQGERLRKKSRSVHFTGETPSSEHLKPGFSHNPKDSSSVSEHEASDSNDGELFVGGPSRGLPLRPSNTLATDSTPKKILLRDALSRNRTQTVRKRIILGPADSQEVDVVFDDVPRTEEPWVRQFIDTNPLVFDRIFTAKDFESQCKQSLSAGVLVHGTLRSDDQTTNLESAADYLRSGSFGILYSNTSFCAIAYPSQCENWKACFPGAESKTSPGAMMRYTVFKPDFPAAQPLIVTGGVLLKAVASNRVNIMRTMFGFNYDELLPAKQQGITQEDCAARREALSIVLDLIGSAKGQLMDEVQEPFIYVNDCIDANDEQSLGNWFGYWSLTKLDSYRKFHILGSHENDYSRSSRDIRIPRYAARTTGDPELALARAGETQAAAQVPPAQDDSGARSQILGRAGGEDFAQHLSSYQFAHVRGFMKLYSYCVSWFNDSFQMADHFGDTTCRFETYRNWFSFTNPFAKPRGYNTYVAFFYTIEGPWDPAAYAKDRLPERHPWIGIWRIVNPHQQPFRATELLIWDIAAPQRVASDRSVHVGSLLPAQKALVDFVKENSAEKNPSMAFQRVWLGGFDPPRLERTTVLDKTLEMLEIMLSDAKQWLPAPEHVLPVRGWRKVNMQHEAPATDLVEQQGKVEDDSPEKMVFHAPRGNGLQGGIGQSKCGNVLFQEVSKFRQTDKTRKHMPYRFPPTMEWYTRQKAEGRHYEHINVDSWEGMFARMGIPSAGGKPTHHRETYEAESSSASAQTTPSH